MLSRIQRLLLYNLVDDRLVEAGPNLRSVQAIAGFLLVEGLPRARRLLLLLDDEVGLTSERTGTLNHLLVQQRVLADVSQDLLAVVLLALPPLYVIARLLVLQALQDLLILSRDLDEFALTGLPVETFARSTRTGGVRGTRLQCNRIKLRLELLLTGADDSS